MKFLFLVTDFNIGGITSSLINLTNELISHGHKVSVLNLPKAQEKPQGLHKDISFVELKGKARLWNLSSKDIKEAKWYKKPWLCLLGFIKKLMNKRGKWTKWIFSKFSLDEKFDYGIAFRQEPTSIYLVANKINCDLKVAFWHSDPDVEDTSSWDQCLYDMDVVAGVSNAVCDSLQRRHSGLKTKTVYNIFNASMIEKQANERMVAYPQGINLLTVSRVEFSQKRLDMIPEIVKKLRSEGFDVYWTVVGDGPHKDTLEQMIREENVSEYIRLVGSQTNPYPYIKQADLFVLTSAWESYGMVVMETLILNTPVVAGAYPALKEILEDGVTGVIAPNSSEGIYTAIRNILSDKNLYERLKKNCEEYKYSSEITYNQFMALGDEINA